MMSRWIAFVLIFACMICPGISIAHPDAPDEDRAPASEVASLAVGTADEPSQASPRPQMLPSERSADSDEQIVLIPEGPEPIVKLSFTDGSRRGHLALERLNADIQLDPWDEVSYQPTDITGWLTGRENSWGRAEHSREESIADMFNDIGCALPVGVTVGLLASESPSENRAGRQARDAMLVTSAATHMLKLIIDSPRPCEADNLDGFPSGHTSMSIAFARAIAGEHRDWGTVAYLWAGGVAWSRVRRGDHSPEQVIGGALLGWLIADAVARRDVRPTVRTPRDGGPMIPAARASW